MLTIVVEDDIIAQTYDGKANENSRVALSNDLIFDNTSFFASWLINWEKVKEWSRETVEGSEIERKMEAIDAE